VIEKQPRKGLKPQQTSASARGKKLTVKQQQFINGKLKGLSSAKAAREAGYAPSVARKADAIITQSPAVRQAIEEILEEAPPRFRVRWDDGHESILTPAAGSLHVEPMRAKATNKG